MSNSILIVEDDATLRDMLSLNLHAAGYQVLEARDDATALDLSKWSEDT
jgi:DNA-binding response OmpR family regulator